MTQQKLNYIHYYLVAIVSTILVWGMFEYISICNGQNCAINTNRLWNGLALITLIFIPITLCIWSEYVNGQLKKLFGNIKLLYEEKTLIFAMAIFISLAIASLMIFNNYWNHFVKEDSPKEYMAALVNLSVFVATLFAPIAALILYDNWKIQKNYDLNKEILLSIDNIIFEIYNDLFKKINCLNLIHNIDKYKIEFENYEDNKNLSNYINELNQLQSKIELYDALNKKELKNHFVNFGGALYRVTNISSSVYDSYDKYASKIKIKKTNNTISNRYKHHEKIMYKDEIEGVKEAIRKKHKYQSADYSTIMFLNFDEAFSQFIEQHNIIIKEVRDKIKA
jgi:hypothetical protein